MTTEPAGPLVHIGEVAERTGLSHRTIRYYEEMDLIAPASRTEGGFRLYDEGDIERLRLIMPMKPLGFTIEQIRDLLGALDALENPDTTSADRAIAQSLIEEMRTSARRRIRELKESTAKAEAFARRLGRTRPVPGEDTAQD